MHIIWMYIIYKIYYHLFLRNCERVVDVGMFSPVLSKIFLKTDKFFQIIGAF
jgi:hypothetical protein